MWASLFIYLMTATFYILNFSTFQATPQPPPGPTNFDALFHYF